MVKFCKNLNFKISQLFWKQEQGNTLVQTGPIEIDCKYLSF